MYVPDPVIAGVQERGFSHARVLRAWSPGDNPDHIEELLILATDPDGNEAALSARETGAGWIIEEGW